MRSTVEAGKTLRAKLKADSYSDFREAVERAAVLADLAAIDARIPATGIRVEASTDTSSTCAYEGKFPISSIILNSLLFSDSGKHRS